MDFDVFISYSRRDEKVCESIARKLKDFGLNVFVDRHSLGPGPWIDQLGKALAQDARPTVVVLASNNALTSKWVLPEVNVARLRGLEILVVGLDPRSVEELDLAQYETLDLPGDATDDELGTEFEARLWLALRYRFVPDQVARLRERAGHWVRQVLPSGRDDYWGQSWQPYVLPVADTGRSRVLTARGGSGKSVITARVVDHVLTRSRTSCPVLVEREHVVGGRNAVCRLVGASSPEVLNEHLDRMRREGHEIFFVIDGLDRLVGDVDTAVLKAVIGMLCSASSLLVTCRTEIWEQTFTDTASSRSR